MAPLRSIDRGNLTADRDALKGSSIVQPASSLFVPIMKQAIRALIKDFCMASLGGINRRDLISNRKSTESGPVAAMFRFLHNNGGVPHRPLKENFQCCLAGE
ncbi:MAG: hypothetical protein IPL49_00870 [Saprospirales bacterium]|nr:hypothetical protein [Saprospirales bacterium]